MKQVYFVLAKNAIFNEHGPWLRNIRIFRDGAMPPGPYVFVTGLPLNTMHDLRGQFTQSPGLLINAGATEQILSDLREGRAYCMINVYAEGWMDRGLIEPMHDYFNSMNIPLSQVIWHTNCANHKAMYDLIVSGDKVNTSFLPFFIHDYTHSYRENDVFRSDPDKHIEKTFLCFNFHHHKHRVEFFTRAVKAGLVDKFYWSFPKKGYRGEYLAAMQFYFPGIPDQPVEQLSWDDAVEANKHLPQVLEPDFNRSIQENSYMHPQLYSNSLVSVITETLYDRQEVHMTEKTFKALTWRHPFVLVATPGSLAYLQSIGFYTFNDFWDESYDQERDHEVRINKIISVLTHIASWDQAQQRQFLLDVQPIIEHNAKWMERLNGQVHRGENKEYVEFLEKYGQET